jgi:hypothetical protein
VANIRVNVDIKAAAAAKATFTKKKTSYLIQEPYPACLDIGFMS